MTMGTPSNAGAMFTTKYIVDGEEIYHADLNKWIMQMHLSVCGTYKGGEITWGIYLRNLPGETHLGELPEEFTWGNYLRNLPDEIYLGELPEERMLHTPDVREG